MRTMSELPDTSRHREDFEPSCALCLRTGNAGHDKSSTMKSNVAPGLWTDPGTVSTFRQYCTVPMYGQGRNDDHHPTYMVEPAEARRHSGLRT